jgi:hypothetical protein
MHASQFQELRLKQVKGQVLRFAFPIFSHSKSKKPLLLAVHAPSTKRPIPSSFHNAHEQSILRCCERVDHCHAAPGKAIVQVFAEQHPAMILGSHGEDERIPYLQVMINSKIERRLEGRPGRICYFKTIRPAENGIPSGSRFAFGFTGEHPVKLAQRLRGK